jgi:hypothetical protein
MSEVVGNLHESCMPGGNKNRKKNKEEKRGEKEE